MSKNNRGGHNRISVQEHIRRGTYRKDRHGLRAQRYDRDGLPVVEEECISDRDTDLLLDSLPEGVTREVAEALLYRYWHWPEPKRVALIALSRAVARLERLEAANRPNRAGIVAERASVSTFLQLLEMTPDDLAGARAQLREGYAAQER
jgi:hypothetical protein